MSRVLVVDDEPDILHLVEHRLRRAGHAVIAVSSAAEAEAQIDERGAPDVAVLDISMPELNGFELLGKLRERDGMHELPAIFLSARVLPADVEAGRAMGATYLTKPFVATALIGAVERAAMQHAERTATTGW